MDMLISKMEGALARAPKPTPAARAMAAIAGARAARARATAAVHAARGFKSEAAWARAQAAEWGAVRAVCAQGLVGQAADLSSDASALNATLFGADGPEDI